MATNKYWAKFHSEIDAYIKARDAYYAAEGDLQDAIAETLDELRSRGDTVELKKLANAMPDVVIRAFIQDAISQIKEVL